ncbi:MAG: hypothetical protein O2863_02725 [Actinomycetota bacterium]|nr:hypothetical protein [Actinomycetota bacterium]
MAEFLNRVGGPNAISLKLWLWLGPVATVGALLSVVGEIGISGLPTLIVFSSVSYLSAGPIFIVAKLYWARKVTYERPRPWLAVAIFGFTGFTFALIFSLLVQNSYPEWGADFWPRSISRTWLSVFWSCILAVALDAGVRFTKARDGLAEEVSALSLLIEERPKAIQRIRQEASTSLKSLLSQYLVTGDPAAISRAADKVSKLVSDQLLQSWDRPIDGLSANPRKRFPLKLIRLMAGPEKTLQLSQIVLLGLMIHSTIWLSWAAVLSALVTGLLIYAHGTLGNRFSNSAFVFKLLSLLFFFSLNILISSQIASWLGFESFSLPGIAAGGWMLAVFLATQYNIDDERAKTLEALQGVVADYEWTLSKFRQDLWAESKTLARIVHGDVQARLRAASLSVKELAESELMALRDACMDAISSDPTSRTMEEFLEELRSLWDGAIQINVSGWDEKVTSWVTDRTSTEAAIEVIREGVTNAARHAQADQIDISFSAPLQAKPYLVIRVANRGKLSDAKPGVGSTILSDLATSWSRSQVGNQVVLEAAVPFEP